MSPDERPVLVAYDGSPESQAAVRAGAVLMPGRPLLVVSVWEPGLAMMMTPPSDELSGLTSIPPSAETMATVDRAQRDHAADAAEAGAAIARELGAEAEPYAVPEERDIAETIAELAERRDAAAVVIGSRGLGRVKSRLLGSTSHGLLRRTQRPVLVVRDSEERQPPVAQQAVHRGGADQRRGRQGKARRGEDERPGLRAA